MRFKTRFLRDVTQLNIAPVALKNVVKQFALNLIMVPHILCINQAVRQLIPVTDLSSDPVYVPLTSRIWLLVSHN